MSDVATRIYIMFLSINAVLVLAGFSVSGNSSIVNSGGLIHGFNVSGTSDSSGYSGLMTAVKSIIDFFFGGGIAGLLIASGLPPSIQLIVGAPMVVLAILGLIPLVTAGVNIVRSVLGWLS